MICASMKYITPLFDPAGEHAAIGAEKSGRFLMIQGSKPARLQD
jgi:hypothetical protein